jgi:hypothetical protein
MISPFYTRIHALTTHPSTRGSMGQPGDAAWSFHLMHRIVDTLNAHSMVYWKVLVKLKTCFYTHREDDLSALIWCMMDGTFYRDRTKLSWVYSDQRDSTLQEMEERIWCLPPKSSQVGTICQFFALQVDWQLQEPSRRCRTPSIHQYKDIEAVKNQLEKVEYAKDPNVVDMYIEIPAGKASSQGLSKWQ